MYLNVFLISLVSWLKETTFWIDFSWVMKLPFRNDMPKHAMENISVLRPKRYTSQTQVKTMLICVLNRKVIVDLVFLEQV
jgi:hypothetical protein